MKEHILIIEDDEAIVKVLRRGLAYEGYQVDVAFDGENGLSMQRKEWVKQRREGSKPCLEKRQTIVRQRFQHEEIR